MIYNLNLGIGLASSGVEYAQSYRYRLLNESGISSTFVFTDFMPEYSLPCLVKNIGIDMEDVTWLYQLGRGSKIQAPSLNKDSIFKIYPYLNKELENKGNYYLAYFDDRKDSYVRIHLDINSNVYRVEIILKGFLTRQDYFSKDKVYCQQFYYPGSDGLAYPYQRVFYREDGTIYLTEALESNTYTYYSRGMVISSVISGKKEFLYNYFKKLKLTSSDVILIDRGQVIAQPLFMALRGIKADIWAVVHAQHFTLENEGNIVFNYHYDLLFRNHAKISKYICSTEKQTETLKRQMKEVFGVTSEDKFVTIPVGYDKFSGSLSLPLESTNNKFLTVSRLSPEKNISKLIEVIAYARDEFGIKDITLDIYGDGEEKSTLESKIAKLGLSDSITIMGHQKMSRQLYSQYVGYLTASDGEGFGLTLLEAVSSACLLFGYDVDYGNTEFCENGVNGLLFNKDCSAREFAKGLASFISDKEKVIEGRKYSLKEVSKRYDESDIASKWEDIYYE